MTLGGHEGRESAAADFDGKPEAGAASSPFAATDPVITEVLDLRTGKLILHDTLIGSDYSEAIKLRMSIRQAIAGGKPVYVCPLCGVPVHLVCRPDRRVFFFRHMIEDGRCSLDTRGALSAAEILARKYDGVKESQAHARLKMIIAESLACDTRFTNIQVESRVNARDRASWRKPDVRALFRGQPIAFEIQLSTTFLSVIAERRAFYQREGYLLVWVFEQFEKEDARLTQDDIFHTNNCNLFLAGPATLEASCQANTFMLDCHWTVPVTGDGAIGMRWQSRFVRFDELTIDRSQQRVFLHDWDRALRALRAPGDDPGLRQEFETFWLARCASDPYDSEAWKRLRQAFATRGLELPPEPNWGGLPGHLLNVLYTAREGRPIGWRYQQFVHAAWHIAKRHKCLLRHFLKALKIYGNSGLLMDEDGSWARKVDVHKACLEAGDPAYTLDRRHSALVSFLFPELDLNIENSV